MNFKLCAGLDYPFRFNKRSVYICSILNGLIGSLLLFTFYDNPMTQYFICMTILIGEIAVLFKGSVSATIGIGLGSLLHLFVIRAVIFASTSIATGMSMYEIFLSADFYPIINLASFAIQIFTLAIFIKFIPLKIVRKIMENKEFYTTLLFLTVILNAYSIYNSYMFTIDYFSVNLAVQEIVISLFTLVFLYIMLLLLIKIFNLGIYKEKTKELEVRIDKDKALTSAILSFAEVIIEANCTKDTVTRVLVNSVERSIYENSSFSDLFNHSTFLTHPEDADIINDITAFSLMVDFENGYDEKLLDFRAKNITTPNGMATDDVPSDYLWYRMRINTNLDVSTSDVISLFTIDEINEEKQAELSLRKKAETDLLTGSYNKDAFTLKVNNYLNQGGQGTLYMFDLDNFKGINDNMGHSAGDDVLRETYAKTTSIFRPNDIVSRVGGDEFLVFLTGTTKDSTVRKKAAQICTDLNKTYHADNGVAIEISCSVGISVAPKDGTDFETLFNAADIAMYHSKSIGKNTFTVYDSNAPASFEPQEKEAYMRLRNDSIDAGKPE